VAEFAINNSVSVSTGQTPFYLNTVQHPTTPADRLLPDASAATAAADALLETLETVLQSVRAQLQIAQGRQAHANRRRRKAPMYKVGDRVWLSTAETRIAQQAAYKLALHRTTPNEVTEVLSPVVCRLKLPDGSRVHDVFHVSRLTPFVAEDRFGQAVKPPAA
jgi:hypothetical protein